MLTFVQSYACNCLVPSSIVYVIDLLSDVEIVTVIVMMMITNDGDGGEMTTMIPGIDEVMLQYNTILLLLSLH